MAFVVHFSPFDGPWVFSPNPEKKQPASIVMFGMKGFHISAIGAIQGHHGPLVVLNIFVSDTACRILMKFNRNVPAMILFRIS